MGHSQTPNTKDDTHAKRERDIAFTWAFGLDIVVSPEVQIKATARLSMKMEISCSNTTSKWNIIYLFGEHLEKAYITII